MDSGSTDLRIIAARGAVGGIANATAIVITSPLDVLKVRFQTEHANFGLGSVARYAASVVRNESIRGLYKGLSVAVVRELAARGTLFIIYEPIRAIFDRATAATDVTVNKTNRVVAGLLAGVISAGIFNPTDVVKIRLQADKLGTRYTSALNAFFCIAREEGVVHGLYKSVMATMIRGSLMASAQMASYDVSKQTLIRQYKFKENIGTHFAASLVSGFVTTVCTSPIDVVRTRIMNENIKALAVAAAQTNTQTQQTHAHAHPLAHAQTQQPKNMPTYGSHAWRACKTILRTEGPIGLFRGFVPSYLRTGVNTAVTFVLVEQLRRIVGLPPF